jgi:hypothetical protein
MNGFIRSGIWGVLGVSFAVTGVTSVAQANDVMESDIFNSETSPRTGSLVDRGIQQQWIKFRDQMVFQAQKAADSLCVTPLLPRSIALSAEFIKVKWDTKDLCSPRGRSLLTARIAAVQLESHGTTGATALSESLLSTPDFLHDVASFICAFPVLPSEVDLKIPPVTIDWNTTAMCRSF